MKALNLAIFAIFCNVIAQISMKYAGEVTLGKKNLLELISPWLIAAVAAYGLSFLLTIRVFALNPISIASPIMAGGSFLLIALSSYFVFGEPANWMKYLGMFLIVIGIAFITRS